MWRFACLAVIQATRGLRHPDDVSIDDLAVSIDDLASQGHFQVIKILHEHTRAPCTSKAMDNAAASGHLDIVKFLHENRTEGCTSKAMDDAARFGHDDIVAFLHEKRTELQTTRVLSLEERGVCDDPCNAKPICTMDAAARGNLSVLQKEARSDLLSHGQALVRRAAEYGQAEIVAFLMANDLAVSDRELLDHALDCRDPAVVSELFHYGGQALFEPSDLEKLLLIGSFDVWLTLRPLIGRGGEDGAATAMERAGSTLRLQTIEFLVETMGRHDLAHLALEGAFSMDQFAGMYSGGFCEPSDDEEESIFSLGAKWLAAIHAVSPGCCRFTLVQKVIDGPAKSARQFRLRYLVSICSDGSHDDAIQYANRAERAGIARFLQEDMDAKTNGLSLPDWLIIEELVDNASWRYANMSILARAIRAVAASPFYAEKPMFTLKNAQRLATQFGHLDTLQWLLLDHHQHTPTKTVDPMLLDRAIYYDHLDIAQWLVENCVAGCQEYSMHEESKRSRFQGWNTTLTWVDSNKIAQKLVDFGAIAACAARHGDLKRLQFCSPQRVLSGSKRHHGPRRRKRGRGCTQVSQVARVQPLLNRGHG